MKFKLKEYHRKISDAQFIEDLVAVSKKMGTDTLRADDYNRYGKYRYLTIRKRFGTWYAALNKAGLKPARMPNIYAVNEAALFKNLADVWIKLGKQPCEKQMKYPLSRFGRTTYLKYFGSWMNALRKFVEHQNMTSPPDPLSDPCSNAPHLPAASSPKEKISGKYLLGEGEEIQETSLPVERDTRHIPLGLKFAVFVRDGFRCTACGKCPVLHPGVTLHCDHIIPWSKGGKTRMDNLRTLCAECNFGKGDMLEVTSGG